MADGRLNSLLGSLSSRPWLPSWPSTQHQELMESVTQVQEGSGVGVQWDKRSVKAPSGRAPEGVGCLGDRLPPTLSIAQSQPWVSGVRPPPTQMFSALHTPTQTPSCSRELPLLQSDAVTALSSPHGDSSDTVP